MRRWRPWRRTIRRSASKSCCDGRPRHESARRARPQVLNGGSYRALELKVRAMRSLSERSKPDEAEDRATTALAGASAAGVLAGMSASPVAAQQVLLQIPAAQVSL